MSLLPGLRARLGGLAVEVVEDPGGAKPDTWRTHRACLEAMPARATHLLVIQDDAVPCAGFARRVRLVVREHEQAIVALFTPGFPFMARKLEAARRRGVGSTDLPQAAFTPVVAIVYPRAHVEGLLAYTSQDRWPRARRLGTADDAIVAGYVRANRLTVMATVPCLVDHDDRVASIAKPSHRPGAHRKAALLAEP